MLKFGPQTKKPGHPCSITFCRSKSASRRHWKNSSRGKVIDWEIQVRIHWMSVQLWERGKKLFFFFSTIYSFINSVQKIDYSRTYSGIIENSNSSPKKKQLLCPQQNQIFCICDVITFEMTSVFTLIVLLVSSG